MAKNNPVEPVATAEVPTTTTRAVLGKPGAPAIVPIPQTDDERAALESELRRSRKSAGEMTPTEEAAFHTRRYHVCLALRGIVYDRATVPIPEREQERAALEHELENPLYYAPFKPTQTMTHQEENVYYIRRRQIMFALAGEPDDTTPAAREHVRRCCG
jgi:hypothetical protein